MSNLRALVSTALFFALVLSASAARADVGTIALTITGGRGYVSANVGDGCSQSCTMKATAQSDVMLTANETQQLAFDHWTGDCSGTYRVCHVDLRTPRVVGAVFRALTVHTLTLERSHGGFIMTSQHPNLQCGGSYNSGQGYTQCRGDYTAGSSVTLRYLADTGFGTWTWTKDCAPAGHAPTCVVTMSANRTVSGSAAAIPTGKIALTITGGRGYISANVGDGCSESCTMTTTAQADVMLTANETPQLAFDHWTGACSGTNRVCHVDTRQPLTVGAFFRSTATHTLTIARPAGGFVATVQQHPSLQCGGSYNGGQGYTQCRADYRAGTSVRLHFLPDTGNTRGTWGGACAAAGSARECVVLIDGDKTVTATMVP